MKYAIAIMVWAIVLGAGEQFNSEILRIPGYVGIAVFSIMGIASNFKED